MGREATPDMRAFRKLTRLALRRINAHVAQVFWAGSKQIARLSQMLAKRHSAIHALARISAGGRFNAYDLVPAYPCRNRSASRVSGGLIWLGEERVQGEPRGPGRHPYSRVARPVAIAGRLGSDPGFCYSLS